MCIGEEQCVFRQGRGCMDQVFAVRLVCEKYLANGKDVFWDNMAILEYLLIQYDLTIY